MSLRIGGLRVTVELETSWSAGWIAYTVVAVLGGPVVGVLLERVL